MKYEITYLILATAERSTRRYTWNDCNNTLYNGNQDSNTTQGVIGIILELKEKIVGFKHHNHLNKIGQVYIPELTYHRCEIGNYLGYHYVLSCTLMPFTPVCSVYTHLYSLSPFAPACVIFASFANRRYFCKMIKTNSSNPSSLHSLTPIIAHLDLCP